MKKIIFFLLLPLSAAGCNLLENDLSMGRPRSYYQRHGGDSDSLKAAKSPGEPETPIQMPEPDTVVFVSAVRCPSDYDWRRDTAYGCPSAELLLFRNGEAVVSIPAGIGTQVSSAPDMHHILDGHLYTEYCDYSRTVVGRDGQELYSVPGRELLKGLLEKDDDLYTLSVRLSEGGFVLRKNGDIVISKTKGDIFGTFDDPSYGQTGALYKDAGQVCFAFRERSGSAYSYHVVRDGSEELVSGATSGLLDVKSVAGKNVTISSSALGFKWKDARIWRSGAGYLVAGESAETAEDGILRVVNSSTKVSSSFRMKGGLIYVSDGVGYALDAESMAQESFCFSPRCACVMGSNFVTVCTPGDGTTPYLDIGGKKTGFDGVGGFLTAVSASVSLPNLTLVPRP